MRHLFGLLCVCALGLMPLVGCETADDGGTGGTAGAGGTAGGGGSAGSGRMPECESAEDCNDSNECTGNACVSGMCEYAPVQDGTACDESNECTVGQCASGACEVTLVTNGTACGDDTGTCQDGSCQVACTEQGIGDAIAAGGGPFTFDCGGPQTVLTAEEIVIDNDVILDGEGNLTVDGGGNPAHHRVFLVVGSVKAELRGFTVTGGWLSQDPKSGDQGAGISNAGSLTVTNSTVSGNSAALGGGILNEGTLTLTNSTVSENTAILGGGIDNEGTLTLTNSTVSENTAILGGGILNGRYFGTLTVTNSTVSGNGDVGIYIDQLASSATVTNSLVDDRCSGPITSNGYNIESPRNTCGFDTNKGDQVNVSTEALNLGELADNGGPTLTHKPGDGGFDDGSSVAINAIPGDACDLTEDQRGQPRPETGGTRCDVGSVEVQPEP